MPAVLPLILERHHVTSYRGGRWFGSSWSSTLDQRLWIDEQSVRFTSVDGMVLHYPIPQTEGSVLPVYGPRWPLSWDGTPGGTMTVSQPETGHTLYFRPVHGRLSADLPIIATADRQGNRITVRYEQDSAAPVEIIHDSGYRIGVERDGQRIVALRLISHPDRPTLMRYTYNADGDLVGVVNSSDIPLAFQYDGRRRITGWTDRKGAAYSYTYDDSGRCVRTCGPDGFLDATFEYDVTHNSVHHSVHNSAHGNGHDTERRVTRATDSLGHVTVFEFNGLLQLVRQIDPLGGVTVQTWDRYDHLLSRTDALGRQTRYSYDERGDLTEVVRPDGTAAVAAYNELGLPVAVTDPDGARWTQSYDDCGRLLQVTDPLGATYEYAYDDAGHIARTTDPLGHSRRYTTDPAGLPLTVEDSLGAVTTYTRDPFGRTVTITNPLGETVRFGWTVERLPAWRRLPDGSTERWTFDGDGNPIEHVNPAGETVRFEVNAFDLISARIAPDGARTEFAYDSEMRITQVTSARGQSWFYVYDAAGRMIHERDFNGRSLSHRYDAAGQLVERTNGVGQSVRYVFDRMGRLVERRHDDRTAATFAYDQAGRVVHATGQDVELTATYDGRGRVLAEACNGRETVRGLPSGVSLTQEWDVNSRLSEQTVTAAAGPGRRRAFAYRGDGYPTRIDDPTFGPLDFDLDPLGRIRSVTGTDWTESYAYDNAGKPTQAAAHGSSAEFSFDGTLLRRAGRRRYEYDGQGRVVRRTSRLLSGGSRTWTYLWDADDRLTDVVTPDGRRWHYVYDPLGRRVAKQLLGEDGAVEEQTDFVWDGTRVAEQSRRDTTTTWEWQPGSHRPLAKLSRSETDERFYALVTDLVGTPTELIGEDGHAVRQPRSSVWGAVAGESRETLCPLRFPGQYFDAETGLHYNLFRYYEPDVGRYLSPDPLGLAPAPDHYAYIRNPLSWTDPLGLTPCREAAKAAALRDAGVPPGAEPLEVRLTPSTTPGGKQILDDTYQPVMFHEEVHYSESLDDFIVFQDHHTGHSFGDPNGIGDQPPHVHVRPIDNPRTGQVPGCEEHYYYDPSLG
ncbi:RHS repeat-associated core domain-containing protein [Streptomyces sp. CBMA29]|uniref:RHS repeat-associated core domain-containing protein n=1 Tax=Streptomyces sp. CBMA29 TaxID=1896314 RepID=UPI001CB6D9ED|nr:RHS repeat-associated core domain-containing protein [Streptomyces sp. CBMA29]